MKSSTGPVLLKGAHVIDPGQGIDGVQDIAIENGKIRPVAGLPSDVETIDLAGSYLTPGWIDIHVHVYGTLGFADPDSIGVCQGVTSYVEAGGPGIGTLDEFLALLEGQTKTTLYAGPYIRPLGILGLNFIESDVRTLTNIPIADWLDFKKAHPGLLRYIKVGAFSGYGYGPTKIGKGLAEILDLPLYAHIGEHQLQPGNEAAYEIYRVSEAGDIVTHVYHGNECGILDKDGKILPVVQEAKNRGVLFDVGFGGFNFSWRVAERAWAQGFFPDIISSDLQQFNVAGPAYSLANVMTCFMKLGMSLQRRGREGDHRAGQGAAHDRHRRHIEARSAGGHHGVSRRPGRDHLDRHHQPHPAVRSAHRSDDRIQEWRADRLRYGALPERAELAHSDRRGSRARGNEAAHGSTERHSSACWRASLRRSSGTSSRCRRWITTSRCCCKRPSIRRARSRTFRCATR